MISHFLKVLIKKEEWCMLGPGLYLNFVKMVAIVANQMSHFWQSWHSTYKLHQYFPLTQILKVIYNFKTDPKNIFPQKGKREKCNPTGYNNKYLELFFFFCGNSLWVTLILKVLINNGWERCSKEYLSQPKTTYIS